MSNINKNKAEKILSQLYTKGRLALEQEGLNANSIHIYKLNNSWVAFERSAYFINKYIFDCGITVIQFDKSSDSDSILLLADITDEIVRHLLHFHDIMVNKCDYKEFSIGFDCPIIFSHYASWRNQQIEEIYEDGDIL